MSMPLKKRYRILRLGVMALTVLAFAGLMLQMMWIIWAVVVLLAGWVALELRWWRCPECGAFLGRVERMNHCPNCGEELDLR